MSKLARIFAIGKGRNLYSLRYADESYEDPDDHELRKQLRQWQDPEYLEAFHEDHRSDLHSGFFGKMTFLGFVDRTISEAAQLTQRIDEAAATDEPDQLAALFRPLDNREDQRPNYQLLKAKGPRYKSWLRLYGIRTRDDVYFITGGAIKLNLRMNDRRHLVDEISRMENARKILSKYVRDDNFYAFFELII